MLNNELYSTDLYWQHRASSTNNNWRRHLWVDPSTVDSACHPLWIVQWDRPVPWFDCCIVVDFAYSRRVHLWGPRRFHSLSISCSFRRESERSVCVGCLWWSQRPPLVAGSRDFRSFPLKYQRQRDRQLWLPDNDSLFWSLPLTLVSTLSDHVLNFPTKKSEWRSAWRDEHTD